jgi:hypothetical protein
VVAPRVTAGPAAEVLLEPRSQGYALGGAKRRGLFSSEWP